MMGSVGWQKGIELPARHRHWLQANELREAITGKKRSLGKLTPNELYERWVAEHGSVPA